MHIYVRCLSNVVTGSLERAPRLGPRGGPVILLPSRQAECPNNTTEPEPLVVSCLLRAIVLAYLATNLSLASPYSFTSMC
jgi:hypothetical protein